MSSMYGAANKYYQVGAEAFAAAIAAAVVAAFAAATNRPGQTSTQGEQSNATQAR